MKKMDYPSRRNNFDQNLDYQLLALLNGTVDGTEHSSSTESVMTDEMDDVLTSTFVPTSLDAPVEIVVDDETQKTKSSGVRTIICAATVLIVVGILVVLCYNMLAQDSNESAKPPQTQPITSDNSMSSTTSDGTYIQIPNETTAMTIVSEHETSDTPYSYENSNKLETAIEIVQDTSIYSGTESGEGQKAHDESSIVRYDETTTAFGADIHTLTGED